MRCSIILVGVCAALGAFVTQTSAEPSSTTATPAKPAAAKPAAAGETQTATADPDQVVCVRVMDTGSRLPTTHECHTRAQWAQLRSSGMDTLGIANSAHMPSTGAVGSPAGQ
jgi:hypothetical protein